MTRPHGPHQHSERLLIQGAIFNGGLKVTIQIRRASTPIKSNIGDSPQLYVLGVLYRSLCTTASQTERCHRDTRRPKLHRTMISLQQYLCFLRMILLIMGRLR